MQVDRAPSEKKEEIPFIIKKANRNTKVSTAAITWLSVREEINTPMARFAHPRRKNPRIPVYAVPKDTVPNFDITRGYRQMIGGLRCFDLIWAMTKGGPGFATDVLSSVVYKQYASGFYGLSTAGNVIMFILIAIIAFPLQRFLNRREVYN